MNTPRSAVRPSRSVRSRLLLWVLVMAALGLALTGGTLLVIQSARIESAADDSLRRGYQEFERHAQGIDPETGRPFADVGHLLVAAMQYRVPGPYESLFALLDGQLFGYSGGARPVELENEPAALAAIGSAPSGSVTVRDVNTSVGLVRLAIVPVSVAGQPSSGIFVIAHALGLEKAGLQQLGQLYLALSGGSLLLIGLVGWRVTGELVRPLWLLREATRQTSASDLSSRLPVRGEDDIAELTRNYNAMLDRLEESFAGQRQLLDDVGHELRTPITITRGHLEIMDSQNPEAVNETRALLLDETDRMGRLVEDLILLAKARRPDFVHRMPVELSDLTDEAFAKARALGPRTWRLEESGDQLVTVDAQRLTQAWLQLAENAVKYSRPGSVVALGSAVVDGQARLWVRDQGVGIRPEELDRVFERFARIDSGRGVEGSGLGLTIVRAIARAHGGEVEVASHPGEGATFTLVVPTGTSGDVRVESAGEADAGEVGRWPEY